MALLAVLCSVGVGACATEDPGIPPPRDAFYFPTGLALWRRPSPLGGTGQPRSPLLLVTNSNADLRYNGATITAIDLSLLPDDLSQVGQWVAEGRLDCAPDRVDPTQWECPEQKLINPRATLRTRNFPGELRVSAGGRLFVPVRGEDELVWADIVELSSGEVDLRCNDDAEKGCLGIGSDQDCPAWDCDEKHRVNFSTALDRRLPAEPLGIYLNERRAVHVDDQGNRRTCVDGLDSPPPCDCGDVPACDPDVAESTGCCVDPRPEDAENPEAAPVHHVYLAHLEGGEISLFTVSNDEVVLEDIRGSFFDVSGSAVGGGYDLAASVPGDPDSPIYVTSRFDGDIASFVVRDDAHIIRTKRVSVGAVAPGDGAIHDLRGIAFGNASTDLHVVSRAPPAVVALDLTAGVASAASRVLDPPRYAVPVCADPSLLVMGPDLERSSSEPRDLAYVVCFADSWIAVVDTGAGDMVAMIRTGRGPHAITLDVGSRISCDGDPQCAQPSEVCMAGRCARKHPRAFVANFLDNTVGVIDLDPLSPSYRRVALWIGLRRRLVEE